MRRTFPPTQDAKWCLEQMWSFMELNLKNRMEARMGHGQALDVTRLSNLMSNAGVAHVSKPRTPISSSRLRRFEAGIEISTEQRIALREVFIYYCSWAEKHNFLFMSKTQFLRFARDSYIMGGDLDTTMLGLVFDKVLLESPEPAPGQRFTLNDWLQALVIISARMYPEKAPAEAWSKLVQDHVLMFARTARNGGSGAADEDLLGAVLLQQDVITELANAKPRLQAVFNFYVNDQEFMSIGRSTSPAYKDLVAAKSQMPFDTFMRFLMDFEVVPRLLNKAQAALAFRMARFGPASVAREEEAFADIAFEEEADAAEAAAAAAAAAASASPPPPQQQLPQQEDGWGSMWPTSFSPPATARRMGPDPGRITLDEFMDAVGRACLMAFNYKRKPEPQKLMAFHAGYHTSAKQLWTEEARAQAQAAMQFPDEVELPAALLEEAIGREDAAQHDKLIDAGDALSGFDSPGRDFDTVSRGPSLRSRAGGIFRSARSVAQYRTKVRAGPGVEVMQIHAEADRLDNDRPMHLQGFTMDWVGAPGMPLNEVSRLRTRKVDALRQSGVYSADQTLPPVYQQRAEQMEGARVAREQAQEVLRLNYVAARRQAALNSLHHQAGRREQLQALSQQPIIHHTDEAQTALTSPSSPSKIRSRSGHADQLLGSHASSSAAAMSFMRGTRDLSGLAAGGSIMR